MVPNVTNSANCQFPIIWHVECYSITLTLVSLFCIQNRSRNIPNVYSWVMVLMQQDFKFTKGSLS